MRRARHVVNAADIEPGKIAGHIALDHENRFRRRLVLRTAVGEQFLLDLSEATHLRHGDGLLLDDGAIVLVEALPEPLLEISAPSPAELLRIAWHLGNRHVPTQLCGNRLRIRQDHVLAELVQTLDGTILPLNAPFDPEGGAYGNAAAAAHDHHHHGHHHAHDAAELGRRD